MAAQCGGIVVGQRFLMTLTAPAAILEATGVLAMKRNLILLSAALVLGACTTTAPIAPPMATPAPSTGAIEGSAAYVTNSGRNVSCAGLSVALMVDTAQTQARMMTLYGSVSHAIQPVEVVKARSAGLEAGPQPINSAACNDKGDFAFSSVQPGLYFLIAHVRRLPPGAVPDDFVILHRVSIQPGETRHVNLAP
jgi:hypothetical protein